MEFQFYQIFSAVFSLVLLFISVRQFLGGHIRLTELVFWLTFWLFTLVVALFPDPVSKFIANTLGIKSNLNALVFIGLGVLFFIQFRLYLIIRKQNEIISDLVRKIAIWEDEQNSSSK